MNKTVWMVWWQGFDTIQVGSLNRRCMTKWKNHWPASKWKTVFIDENNVHEYVPEYFEIIENSKYKRGIEKHADLLRLLLLKKYGGVWADASVFPMKRLDDWIEPVLEKTGFFTYRFIPRLAQRETVSWFLATDRPNHYLISKWLDKFIHSFINIRPREGPEDHDGLDYFQVHKDLSYLYDTDPKIKHIINNMEQISESGPHSAMNKDGWLNRRPSYMYKRPNMPPDYV